MLIYTSLIPTSYISAVTLTTYKQRYKYLSLFLHTQYFAILVKDV